jgi:hypothetical protein
VWHMGLLMKFLRLGIPLNLLKMIDRGWRTEPPT